MAGCGAQLSKADLGTVIFEVPNVPGTEEPYQMPQLGPSEDGAAKLAADTCHEASSGYDDIAGKTA